MIGPTTAQSIVSLSRRLAGRLTNTSVSRRSDVRHVRIPVFSLCQRLLDDDVVEAEGGPAIPLVVSGTGR